MRSARLSTVAAAMLLATTGMQTRAADQNALRAYPIPLPEDVTFDTVVNSQPFPRMKFPVPIIGAKVHPEEVHVTPAGALVFPRYERFRGPCVAILVGSRPNGEKDTGQVALSMPPAEAVTSKLIDGYMPGVENTWTMGDLQLRQVTFATEVGQYESSTGTEPLIALTRYTITNRSNSERQVVAAILYGEAQSGLSVKAVPPAWSEPLSFESPCIRQADGAVAARLLTKDLRTSFKPLPKSPDRSHYVTLNEKEESVKSAEYSAAIERQGDAVTVGKWQSPGGADVYVESSRGHSVPLAVDVAVVTEDGRTKPVGTLYRTGLSGDTRPASDFVTPGQHTAALTWSELAKALPEGKSKLVMRCFYPAGEGRAPVGSWEPIVHFARPV